MFITFSMAVMRMSGAIGFNPLFGKSNFPVKIRAYFVFALALLLYLCADQTKIAYPESMAEYILMLYAPDDGCTIRIARSASS